ncbi:hypothetical protein FHG87_023134 [Trinorchestia longiramus]|nr:hypothetical protein FHG87_023134 [Trinorchestia longiramus]
MEKIQSKATNMISEIGNFSYEKCFYQIELISLEHKRLRGQLIETYSYKYLNGFNDIFVEGLFDRGNNVRTRNNGRKLIIINITTFQSLKLSLVKITGTWKQLPKNIVSVGTVNT